MYAIIETGGKQYKAAKGDVVFVEKLDAEAGKAVSFDALVVSDGDNVMIGTPTVKGAKVKAKVVEHGKGKKIIVFKFKPKKDYRKKQGHRQPFTKIEITGIITAKDKAANFLLPQRIGNLNQIFGQFPIMFKSRKSIYMIIFPNRN